MLHEYFPTLELLGPVNPGQDLYRTRTSPHIYYHIYSLQKPVKNFAWLKTTLPNLRHPSLQPLQEMQESNEYVWLCMLVPEGSDFLENCVVQRGVEVAEGTAAKWAKQLAEALAQLHDSEVIHRRIGTKSIMKTREGDVLLTSLHECVSTSVKHTRIVGQRGAIAPENWASQDYDSQADIWSLGSLFYTLLMRRETPPQGLSAKDLITLQEELEPDTCEFISACLRTNPAERPTAHQLRSFPFVTGRSDWVSDLQSALATGQRCNGDLLTAVQTAAPGSFAAVMESSQSLHTAVGRILAATAARNSNISPLVSQNGAALRSLCERFHC